MASRRMAAKCENASNDDPTANLNQRVDFV